MFARSNAHYSVYIYTVSTDSRINTVLQETPKVQHQVDTVGSRLSELSIIRTPGIVNNEKNFTQKFNTRKRLHGHFQIYSGAKRVSVWR